VSGRLDAKGDILKLYDEKNLSVQSAHGRRGDEVCSGGV